MNGHKRKCAIESATITKHYVGQSHANKSDYQFIDGPNIGLMIIVQEK